jgi:predicted dehydrogenase
MKRDYKAVLFGNGTMGERHRKFFEYSGVQFLKIFDLEDLDSAGNVRVSLIDEFISDKKIDFAVIASPATTHYEYAKLCLERGISVFVARVSTKQ